MDNLTHSLIGIAIGYSARKKTDKSLNRAAIWTAVLASNLPDLDFLFPYFTGDHANRMAYIAHHRGYTHTLILAPVIGLLAAWLGALIAKVSLKSNFAKLAGIGLLGALLHVAADYTNDYGVHPFSPFYNGWFYGSFMFILEPFVWITFFPLAYELSVKNVFRYFWIVATVAVLALAWSGKVVAWGTALALTVWAARCWLLQLRQEGVMPALRGLAAVLLVFGMCSLMARDKVDAVVAQGAPGEQVLQRGLSPSPANPFCWRTVVVSSVVSPAAAKDQVRVRMGALSLLPVLQPAMKCFKFWGESHTMPTVKESLPSSEFLAWTGEFHGSRTEIHNLASRNCEVATFLRFARAPFWFHPSDVSQPDEWVLGDARYDRGGSSRGRFSEFRVKTSEQNCLHLDPPWLPPSGI